MKLNDIQKMIGLNAKKKSFFIRWYVDETDKTKENYNKQVKHLTQVEFETALEWLKEEDVQNAMKEYLKSKRSILIMNIYDAMYKKALAGDVKSSEWVENFFKSDYFGDDLDEVNTILDGIEIPALKGDNHND